MSRRKAYYHSTPKGHLMKYSNLLLPRPNQNCKCLRYKNCPFDFEFLFFDQEHSYFEECYFSLYYLLKHHPGSRYEIPAFRIYFLFIKIPLAIYELKASYLSFLFDA